MSQSKQIDHSLSSTPVIRRAFWLDVYFLFLLLLSFGFHPLAQADYAKARGKFNSGDVPGAFMELESTLKAVKVRSGPNYEKTLKLYGIVCYLLGKSEKSKESFNRLLGLNPNATLDSKDVLDPSIQTLFNGLKNKSSQKQSSQKKSENIPIPPAPVPKALAPPSPPKGQSFASNKQPIGRRPAPVAAPAPQAFTGIFVKANVPRATIYDSGIFVGISGQDISLDPGKHDLTITAEGYQDKKKTVNIGKGQKIQIGVTLFSMAQISAANRKKALEDQQKAAAARQAQAQKQAQAQRQAQAKQAAAARAKTAPPAAYLSSGLPGEASPSPYGTAPNPGYTDPSYGNQPPPAGYGSGYQGQGYPPAQGYQGYGQPGYPPPQGYPPAQGYLPPGYVQPYGGQPVYQQPAAPTVIVQQQPVYSAPQGQAYPSELPPAAEPRSDTFEYEEEAKESPYFESAPKRSSRKTKLRTPKRSAFLAVLPFGVGQYQNGQSVKGFFFMSLQAGFLGYGVFQQITASNYQKKIDQYKAENPNWEQETNPEDEKESKAYIARLKTYYLVGYSVAGAGWLLSIVDAFANINRPEEVPAGSRSRRAYIPPVHLPDLDHEVAQSSLNYKIGMGWKNELSLGVEWKF